MTRYIVLSALLLITAILALIFITGAYPFVFMRASKDLQGATHVIWARTAHRIADAALTYYQTTLGTATTTIAITPALKQEAREKALDALIDQALITDAVRLMDSDAEAKALLNKKFAAYEERSEFVAALSLSYGLDTYEFAELIAYPEIEKEMLKQKKGWNDTELRAWLAEEKSKARIVRFAK